MNIEDTLAPKSDQLDAIDLLSGSRVFTVVDVSKGSVEQPVQIHFAELSRPWRPGVTMRRLVFKLWGGEGREYVGRRVELYNDEAVTFGTERTGGIRIRSMSDIGPKARTETLPVSRGRYGKFTVQPLPDSPPPAPVDPNAARIAELGSEWKAATPERRVEIEAEVAKLKESTDAS